MSNHSDLSTDFYANRLYGGGDNDDDEHAVNVTYLQCRGPECWGRSL